MVRKIILILFLFLVLPAFADYQYLSNTPMNNSKESYQDEDKPESPEFEYPTTKSQTSSVTPQSSSTQSQTDEKKTQSTDTKPQTPPEKSIPATKNYAKIYNELEPANFSYMHDIDPDQYYDIKDATWSPYPLLRLNSAIYFKDKAIEPGYYLLTPREHKGNWFLLFKQGGLVKHIIPIYDKSMVPQFFYDKHLEKPKLKTSQKVHMGVLNAFGKLKSSKRKEAVKCYMEINDLENYFVSIIIYYGNYKYSTIFRTIRL